MEDGPNPIWSVSVCLSVSVPIDYTDARKSNTYAIVHMTYNNMLKPQCPWTYCTERPLIWLTCHGEKVDNLENYNLLQMARRPPGTTWYSIRCGDLYVSGIECCNRRILIKFAVMRANWWLVQRVHVLTRVLDKRHWSPSSPGVDGIRHHRFA